jgi:plastocyanin
VPNPSRLSKVIMLLRNKTCRCITWLGTGLLVAGCAGCQGADAPSPRESRETASAGQADRSTENGLSSPAEAASVNGATKKVSIDNFTFHPESLEIAVGTTVVWVNGDDVPHTVRSTEDLFRSGTLDTDDVYEHVFSEPGTYEYYCGVHRHMSGKIVVK